MAYSPKVVTVIAVAVFTFGATHARELTFDERVRAQEKIDRVYYAHQVGATAPFETVYTKSVLENRVRRYLTQSAALQLVAKRPITADALHAETARIARDTRLPGRLEELYAALEHDAFLFEECVARSTLADRLSRASFRNGPLPEVDPGAVVAVAADAELPQPSRAAASCPADDTWEAGSLDDQPIVRYQHVAVWTGSEMIVWGGALPNRLELGHRYDPLTDTWKGMSTVHAPVGRVNPSIVWTGTKVIVWGGSGSGVTSEQTGSGGVYDPAADTWTPTSMVDSPAGRSLHTAVWTGSRMIVWGGSGVRSDGALYDPATNTWTSVNASGAPVGRQRHSAVWTGTEMVVWGGETASGFTNTGARYNPATDSWTAISTTGAPGARIEHTTIWTGTRMIVWGGELTSGQTATGGRYDPVNDVWQTTRVGGAPVARWSHTAVWTGSRMIVWGGRDSGSGFMNSGGIYDPGSNQWTSTNALLAPPGRALHTAVWDGTEMIVYGGQGLPGGDNRDDGARYDPATDGWVTISTGNGDLGRHDASSVWTGTEMIGWGGTHDLQALGTGFRYDALLDQWAELPLANAPAPRTVHTAVWTGTEMIVWGGAGAVRYGDGARYDLATDAWTPVSDSGAPAARSGHTAVWTGTEMVVWGGYTMSSTNTGARYRPATDTWTATSLAGAPSARNSHVAVWDGEDMIVWGGAGPSYPIDGARYAPAQDTWTAIASGGAPSGRIGETAVWTGREMIVWGGGYSTTTFPITFIPTSTGARYDPWTDAWTPTALVDAPSARAFHAGLWTGKEMFVWGAQDDLSPTARTGGRYDPAADAWRATSVDGAPFDRGRSVTAWSGAAIVWSGSDDLRTGSRYFVDSDQDGVSDACDPDDDDDGVADGLDCSPADPAVASVPGEVAGLTMAKPGTQLAWADEGPVRYDVASGLLSALRMQGGFAGAECAANNVLSTVWEDARPGPDPGDGYYYLTRAANACGPGTYGTMSGGSERNVASCP